MLSTTNLAKVNQLYEERRAIDGAIGNFDAGGRIITMTVSGVPEEPPGPGPSLIVPRVPVIVPTTGIDYPPEMVVAIKEKLTARKAEIALELNGLGVEVPAEPPPPEEREC